MTPVAPPESLIMADEELTTVVESDAPGAEPAAGAVATEEPPGVADEVAVAAVEPEP